MQVPRLRRHVDGWPGHVGLGGGGNVHLGRVQRDHVCSVEYYLAALYQVLLSSAVSSATGQHATTRHVMIDNIRNGDSTWSDVHMWLGPASSS